MYGLKCGPAELQPFVKSPFSCTWKPCKPGLKPEIVPVTLTPSGCCSSIRIPRGPSIGEPSSPRAFSSTTAFKPTACAFRRKVTFTRLRIKQRYERARVRDALVM